MASISGKGTKPEISVRKKLFALGFRYRKNVKSLPGKPDIALPKYQTVILIHGCFWHGHHCKKARRPSSNIKFWNSKIESNINRDKIVLQQLRKKGWKVITIWECEINNKEKFSKVLKKISSMLIEK